MEAQESEFEILDFSKEGLGIGKINGSKVKVAHAYPGDVIKAELCKKKRHGFLKGRLKEVLKPSLNRVAPKCAHSTLCGGCKLGQFDYQAQLSYKESLLKKTFKDFPEAEIFPIIPSEPWEYRGKMEFTFSENRAGTKFLGLMIASAGKYVFNVEECFLSSDWMYRLLNQVRLFWQASGLSAFSALKEEGVLRYLTLRETKRTFQKMVILTVMEKEPFLKEKDHFIKTVLSVLPENEVTVILRHQKTEKGFPTTFEEEVLLGSGFIEEKLCIKEKKLQFKISPFSFFQPNPLQAEKLFLRALELSEIEKEPIKKTVFDLYAGSAALGMVFAPFAKEVISIEENEAAVLDAKKNAALNGFSNLSVLQGDVGKVLSNLRQKGPLKADLAVVDPPRAGLDPLALEHILSLNAQKIVYISCNIETQQKNILELASHGYSLKALQPVDQFPQTMHLENIALLVKND